jgi:DNA replication and repair protein RecF
MVLRSVEYQGFRNLVDTRLECAEDFNFFIGENGAGKTNVLEAIYFVGLASSFRVREECNLVNVERQYLRVDAEADGITASIYLDGARKKMRLQGNDVSRLSDYIGWLGITILSIDDIWLVRGSPARRRSFLDWALAKISPSYLSHLTEYRRIMRQRNKVLQSVYEHGDASLLDVFDEQMIVYGNKVYEERERNLPELANSTTSISSHFGIKHLVIDYQSSCPDMRIDEHLQRKVRQKEIAFGQTIIGPHRDDVLLSMNGHPLKCFASEGEERSIAISLKLAEAEMLRKKKKAYPLLLLDEVAAELDHGKREILLGLLNGQVFYASTTMPERSQMGMQKACKIFTVKRGELEVSATN